MLKFVLLLGALALTAAVTESSTRTHARALTRARLAHAVRAGNAKKGKTIEQVNLGTLEFLNKVISDFANDQNAEVKQSLNSINLAVVDLSLPKNAGDKNPNSAARLKYKKALDSLVGQFAIAVDKSGQGAWDGLKKQLFEATNTPPNDKAVATAWLAQLGFLNADPTAITEKIIAHMKAVAGSMSETTDGQLLDMSKGAVEQVKKCSCAMNAATQRAIVSPSSPIFGEQKRLKCGEKKISTKNRKHCNRLSSHVKKITRAFVEAGKDYMSAKAASILPGLVSEMSKSATTDQKVKAMIEAMSHEHNSRQVFLENPGAATTCNGGDKSGGEKQAMGV